MSISRLKMRKVLKIKKYLLGVLLLLCLAVTNFSFAENSTGEQKEVRFDKGQVMHAYVNGSEIKTIVMLSGWGTESPLDDFKPLVDKLSDKFKVVVLECFGYGKSTVTSEERTNENNGS